MGLFLGVDGGQSSTVALIADETGRVLGAGTGGPCNHVAAVDGRAKFAKAMEECLQEACLQAGLNARSVVFEAACLGFSGGIADKESYSRDFIRSHAFKITHDAEIALTGATGGERGIIVIAGTGSIAFGKNSEGKTSRVGGWGYIFGDEGGAFDIVRQALRAALAMEEGWGRATALRAALLKRTGACDANQLMHKWYNEFDRRRVAQLAPLVDEAACLGDEVANEILAKAGRQLARFAVDVHGKLFEPVEMVPVSLVGGVFESHLLTNALRQSVLAAIGCDPKPPLFPPAGGALLEALRMAGIGVRLRQVPAIKS
jgi:N-acetylglucosamine kinase-like BadF-type ATPase